MQMQIEKLCSQVLQQSCGGLVNQGLEKPDNRRPVHSVDLVDEGADNLGVAVFHM